jgi:hypothetical protein
MQTTLSHGLKKKGSRIDPPLPQVVKKKSQKNILLKSPQQVMSKNTKQTTISTGAKKKGKPSSATLVTKKLMHTTPPQLPKKNGSKILNKRRVCNPIDLDDKATLDHEKGAQTIVTVEEASDTTEEDDETPLSCLAVVASGTKSVKQMIAKNEFDPDLELKIAHVIRLFGDEATKNKDSTDPKEVPKYEGVER